MTKFLVLLLLAGCASFSPSSSLPGWRHSPDCCQAEGKKFGIASGGHFASIAGAEILGQGGNLIDAAVATSFVLAVERPHSAGLGGGGFLTYFRPGEKAERAFVDFRETAPAKASRDMYLDAKGKVIPGLSRVGAKAVATPGFVAGLYEIHRKWGKLEWKKVLAPAIHLAREGFPVYSAFAVQIKEFKDELWKDPYSRRLLSKENGEPLQEGELFVQKDLGETLERIAANGRREMETGETSRRILKFMQARKGLITASDLKNYEVRFRKPLETQFEGYSLITAPPPSAGGVMLAQMFNVLSLFPIKTYAPADLTHLLAEVMKRGYSDRSRFIGDPDFYRQDINPLISPEAAKKIRDKIDLIHPTPSSSVQPGDYLPKFGPDTTHLSLLHQDGSGVAATLTINEPFGCRMAVPGTGIFLNNEMDDFSAKPGVPNAYGLVGAEANAIEPKKRPVSSMTPTLFVKDGKAMLSLGAAGGSYIISSVFQVALHTLALEPEGLRRALFGPRVHHQWLPDELVLEAGFPAATQAELEKRGYKIGRYRFAARVQAVQATSAGFKAVYDPRDDGGAVAQ